MASSMRTASFPPPLEGLVPALLLELGEVAPAKAPVAASVAALEMVISLAIVKLALQVLQVLPALGLASAVEVVPLWAQQLADLQPLPAYLLA